MTESSHRFKHEPGKKLHARWWAKAKADLCGYFWLPCPCCGEMFAGHEYGGCLNTSLGGGKITCPACPGEIYESEDNKREFEKAEADWLVGSALRMRLATGGVANESRIKAQASNLGRASQFDHGIYADLRQTTGYQWYCPLQDLRFVISRAEVPNPFFRCPGCGKDVTDEAFGELCRGCP